ncbi:MAG: cytidine deaminase [Bacteroidia bacterium]|nr:cytidine deaminase [Bacteroidia bacterium]
MKEGALQILYRTYEDREELEPDERELLEKAWEATDHAYAPFSEFKVGCAISLVDGEIVLGNNQENRAYPSGLCAERTAMFFIGAQGRGADIRKLAVRARSLKNPVTRPVMPCGACRQVMLEYEEMAEAHFVILMQGETGSILRMESVKGTLLPFPFDLDL